MNQKFFNEFGYRRDRESTLRAISSSDTSLASEAANQIKHLKQCLKDMVQITEIHQDATGNNFAWAEIECAKEALSVTDE